MTLNCTANQVVNLFTPPTITWIAPDGREVPTIGVDGSRTTPVVDPLTRELIFSDITTSNRGTYTCRAVVDIPEAQIVNFFDETTAEVNTACELYSIYYFKSHIIFVLSVPGVIWLAGNFLPTKMKTLLEGTNQIHAFLS